MALLRVTDFPVSFAASHFLQLNLSELLCMGTGSRAKL